MRRYILHEPSFPPPMRENMPVKTSGTVLACFVFAASWLAAGPARAAVVAGLYEARVPVVDQSAAQRSAASQQAFTAVLVKVTGDRAASGALAKALGNPSQYVQQYRFEKVDADPATDTPAGLMLWAKFDPGVIAKALRGVHSPLWGAERPRTLVWLALPDRILAANDGSPLMQALLIAAQQRGIALVFPQMDAADKSALAVADIAASNDDRIRQASLRYKADAILVGRIVPTASQFTASWQWISPDQTQGWQTPAGDEVLVAVDGVEIIADRFAARYAIAPGAADQDGVELQVDGIDSLDAYAKVLSYLGTLTPVRAVRVERVAGGSVFYSLDIHGSLDNLGSALVLGGLLYGSSVVAPAAASAIAAAPLRYSYKP